MDTATPCDTYRTHYSALPQQSTTLVNTTALNMIDTTLLDPLIAPMSLSPKGSETAVTKRASTVPFNFSLDISVYASNSAWRWRK